MTRIHRARRLGSAALITLVACCCSQPGPPASTGRHFLTVGSAARDHLSDVEVETTGRVQRVLADDRTGSPHQRFILVVDDSLTVLVVHNLDIAPRVPVTRGATLSLRGEYVWNDKGGLIHWTHRDPAGRHRDGWIRYAGRLYQ